MSEQNNADKRRSGALYAFASVSQIGITMAVTVLVGVFLGKYLDKWLGTAPWLLLVCSLLGAGAAMRTLFHTLKDTK